MISLLRLRNIAIFEEVEFEFTDGLNVITGQTGAGKSITLKGLELLAGGKASADLVRNGSDKCEVEGIFEISPSLCSDLEIEPELVDEGELVVRRVISSSGKSRAYLGGKLVSQAELKRIGWRLIDITGQHYQHRLLDKKNYRPLLDSFGVSTELITQCREAYSNWTETKRKRREFEEQSREKTDYLRRITFEAEELSDFALTKGEKSELEDTLGQQEAVENLKHTSEEGLELLESDQGIIIQLAKYLNQLRSATESSAKFAPALELVQSSELQLQEAASELRAAAGGLEINPEDLENMRSRLTDLIRLERKYGKSETELLDYFQSISAEVELYQSGQFDADKLIEAEQQAHDKLRKVEKKLTAERKEMAKALSAQVIKELKQLDMKKARFEAKIIAGESSKDGADEVEFLLAANPGEPARALEKVASGGEISRVLLILKTLLSAKTGPVLQVFDEIDSGSGGAVAQTIGEKLQLISRRTQVLLVTHAPQVAALADHHFYVSKQSDSKKTLASVDFLDLEGRVEEVARMLAGKNVSGNFLSSARELIGIEQKTTKKTVNKGS